MTKARRAKDLTRRLLAGEQLSDDERALLLASVTPKAAHRPHRDDLKVAQDELRRVLHFLQARLTGKGYQEAIDTSADASAISASRVKGALSWFSKTTRISWQEALSIARTREERNARIVKGGIDALTPNEIFVEGITLAFTREFGTRPNTKRAALYLHHGAEIHACLEAIWRRSLSLFESLINGNPPPVKTRIDFALLIEAVATAVAKEEVQKLDHLMN